MRNLTKKIKVSSFLRIRRAITGFVSLLFIKKAHFDPVKIAVSIWCEDKEAFFERMKKVLKCIAEYRSALYVWERSNVSDFNVYLMSCSRYESKSVPLDHLKINVRGLEFYEEEKKKGSRLIFIGWHHGHFFMAKDFLFRLEPMLVSYGPLECYTRKNKVSVVERFSNSVQMLARMLQDLNEKKTLHYLFDGVMGVRTKAYNLFDKKVYLPNALSKFMKNTRVVILPINAYLKDEGELDVFIERGVRLSNGLQAADESIINSFLALFEKNILSNAPAMVNYSELAFLENSAVGDNF